jgi:hypothetical protein
MAKMIQSNTPNTKPMNKWLMLLLLLTVIATAWTALSEDGDNANTDIELQNVSSNAQQLQKPSAPISQVKQELTQMQLASSDTALSNTAISKNTALIPWQKLKREANKSPAYDLFKAHSWLVVPPAKKVKPEPPPPPVAPPAPFTYIGKLDNTPTGTQLFLMANNKLYTVVKGGNIDQQWRLDAEEGELLRLTYLPLSLQQTLSKFARPSPAQPEATAEIN